MGKQKLGFKWEFEDYQKELSVGIVLESKVGLNINSNRLKISSLKKGLQKGNFEIPSRLERIYVSGALIENESNYFKDKLLIGGKINGTFMSKKMVLGMVKYSNVHNFLKSMLDSLSFSSVYIVFLLKNRRV